MMEPNEKIPMEWRPDERYIAVCGRCGIEVLKRNAVSIYVKRGAYTNLKILLHFCDACYCNFLEDYGVSER